MHNNNYSQLKFCFKKAYKLNNNILTELLNQLKFRYRYHFNVKKNHEIINESNVDILNKQPHLVTFDINSHPFLLFLTTIKSRKYCLFIENKGNLNLKIYSVKFRFSNELYNGTIFEGELTLNDRQCWIYFINNIYCMNGNILKCMPLSKRLETISDIIKKKYKYDEYMNVCHVQIKSYFLYHHLEMLKELKKIKNSKILFIPENDDDKSYIFYLNNHNNNNHNHNHRNNTYVRKNVSTSKNIDSKESIFQIVETDLTEVYKLWTYNERKRIYKGIACISGLHISKFVKKLFEQVNNKNDIYVYCKYSDHFKSWIPVKEFIPK